jgi:hypothetical protein
LGKTVKLVIEIDEDLRRELRIRALRERVTVKEIVTRLVVQYLSQGETKKK